MSAALIFKLLNKVLNADIPKGEGEEKTYLPTYADIQTLTAEEQKILRNALGLDPHVAPLPRNPMDVFQSFIPPSLVNSLDRYSQPPPPIEGKFVMEIGLDKRPFNVACHAGKVYVTHLKSEMSVLDVKSGVKVNEWTLPGAKLTGVAGHGEHVFVVDADNNCIRVLDMEGKQERQFGTSGSGNGEFNHPDGVAIANELLYICDTYNHRVQVFELDGTWVRSWGSRGSEEGQFNYPSGITVHNDEVYVAGFKRVQVFGLDGTFRRMWVPDGVRDGEYSTPFDVIVHGELVYVTDTFNHRVQIFKLDGELVTSWGIYGRARFPGRFSDPTGLCVDDQYRMWVCDSQNNRLQLFR